MTRMLVIENDGDAAALIRSALDHDYTLDVVTTVEHGVELATRRAYALALIEDAFVSEFREALEGDVPPIVSVRWPFAQSTIEDAVAEALLDTAAG